ncbi:MAG: prepilin-type N-terminal cleavage/methylation domain-containing protein [Alphaproteobacteria bacterium]
MKKNYTSKKSAFSLIELSIVLIIIGLLIAGITGGASLIKSSELRTVIGEARGYAVAVNAFFTQYDAFPGDFSTAISSPDNVGNQNGRMEFTNASNINESSEAWRDLRTAGAIDNSLTFAAFNVAQTPVINFPGSKTKSNGWVYDSTNADQKNWVVLTGSTTASANTTDTIVNGTSRASAALIPTDALSIDSKTDDGRSTTGRVIGVISACISGTAYQVSTTTRACALAFNVDVNNT